MHRLYRRYYICKVLDDTGATTWISPVRKQCWTISEVRTRRWIIQASYTCIISDEACVTCMMLTITCGNNTEMDDPYCASMVCVYGVTRYIQPLCMMLDDIFGTCKLLDNTCGACMVLDITWGACMVLNDTCMVLDDTRGRSKCIVSDDTCCACVVLDDSRGGPTCIESDDTCGV